MKILVFAKTENRKSARHSFLRILVELPDFARWGSKLVGSSQLIGLEESLFEKDVKEYFKQ